MDKTLFIIFGLTALISTVDAVTCAIVSGAAYDANCVSDGCSSTAANVCTAGNCNAGYYFNNSVCTECDPTCDTCDDSGANKCTDCASTYGSNTAPYVGSPQTCSSCPTNCNSCNGDITKCTFCGGTYSLYNGLCCPSNCAECSDITVCTTCSPGYELQTAGTCISSGFRFGAVSLAFGAIIFGLCALTF